MQSQPFELTCMRQQVPLCVVDSLSTPHLFHNLPHLYGRQPHARVDPCHEGCQLPLQKSTAGVLICTLDPPPPPPPPGSCLLASPFNVPLIGIG